MQLGEESERHPVVFSKTVFSVSLLGVIYRVTSVMQICGWYRIRWVNDGLLILWFWITSTGALYKRLSALGKGQNLVEPRRWVGQTLTIGYQLARLCVRSERCDSNKRVQLLFPKCRNTPEVREGGWYMLWYWMHRIHQSGVSMRVQVRDLFQHNFLDYHDYLEKNAILALVVCLLDGVDLEMFFPFMFKIACLKRRCH